MGSSYLAGPSAAAAAIGVAWVTGVSSEPSFLVAGPLGMLLFCLRSPSNPACQQRLYKLDMIAQITVQCASCAHRLAGTNPIGRRAAVPTGLSSTAALHHITHSAAHTKTRSLKQAAQSAYGVGGKGEAGEHTSHGRICARVLKLRRGHNSCCRQGSRAVPSRITRHCSARHGRQRVKHHLPSKVQPSLSAITRLLRRHPGRVGRFVGGAQALAAGPARQHAHAVTHA